MSNITKPSATSEFKMANELNLFKCFEINLKM